MFKERIIFQELLQHVNKKEFTIITGSRQVGKTTILKEIFKRLKSAKKDVWFISFEKENVLRSINNDPENIFQYTNEPVNPLYNESTDINPVYILIDEIQYAENPTNFLKYLYDTFNPNLKIIATGSSAFYVDKKFKDSLSGRKRIFVLKPLNFEEFLLFQNQSDLINELLNIRNRKEYISLRYNELLRAFNEMVTYGGYPDVVLATTHKEKLLKLEEIKNSYVKRDIIESGVDNESGFYQLLVVLSSQTGNLMNKNELSKVLRINNKTIEHYLIILQKCFHINLVKPFYSNVIKELTKMPKVYFNDLGLRNILLNRFYPINEREDKGQLLENYVYIRLKELYNYDEIKYWRTTQGNEVDFVVNESYGKGKAFEVKFNISTLKLSKYKSFKNLYPDYPLKFIEYGYSNYENSISALKL